MSSGTEAASVVAALSRTGLPLVPKLPDVVSALSGRRLAVLRADPGSGKSTLVPLALMEAPAFADGRILMLEPRRVAAVSVAARMAELLGEEVGGRVGYSVRLERRASRNTRVEVLTEGLLVKRILADPGLEGVGAVLFDEFHERSIHSDLALALCLDLRRLRGDLSILLMSATMDGVRAADFLRVSDAAASGRDEPVPLVDCPGRPYPVAVEHRPLPRKRRTGEESAEAVYALLGEGSGDAGDILVFLPGRREIEEAAAALKRLLAAAGGGDVEVRVLHGSLSLGEQRAALRPRERGRRVVLATNIAETSLTVPGVSIVVDAGLVKTQRFHLASGLDRLVLENSSERSSDQRAGRAGRLRPGRCVRLWPAGEARPRDTESEILRADAAPLVLDCALWGARRPEDLFWLDPPGPASWNAAAELLRGLGALSPDGAPTDRGKRMAALGVHPRLAAVVLAGEAAGQASLAVAAAAVRSDRAGAGIRDDAAVRRRRAVLRGAERPEREGLPGRGRTAELAADLCARLGRRLPSGGRPCDWAPADEASVGILLLAGFPDRAARRQDSPSADGTSRAVFRFPSGREARVEGPLEGEEWLVAVDAEAGDRAGTIRLAAPVRAEDAERALAAAYPESRADEWAVDWEGLKPRSRAVRRAGRLVLRERRGRAPAELVAAAFGKRLAAEGLGLLPWDGEGGDPRSFLERARFWARARGNAVLAAALEDAGLLESAAAWLLPSAAVDGRSAETVLTAAELLSALKALVGWETAALVEKEAPERLETPAGTRRRLCYEGGSVALEARIQELFGLARTPLVAGVPILLRLLSPAERPLQTTADLESFWKNTYPEVRKEMRGRYPRHYWPEDPLVAEPTSRPKPRGS